MNGNVQIRVKDPQQDENQSINQYSKILFIMVFFNGRMKFERQMLSYNLKIRILLCKQALYLVIVYIIYKNTLIQNMFSNKSTCDKC
jgi:hypothetical protein